MDGSADPNTVAASRLDEKLKKTVAFAADKGLSPELTSALCVARIGVSSLDRTLEPGCGAGPEIRALADELHALARRTEGR